MGMIQPLIAFMIVTAAPALQSYTGPLPTDPYSGPLAIIAFLALAFTLSRREVQSWLETDPADRGELPGGHPWLMLLAWAGVSCGSSWAYLCNQLAGAVPGGFGIVAILPWIVLRVLLCRATYPLEQVTGRPWSLREFTSFHVRVTLMVLVPVMLVRVLLDVLFLVPRLGETIVIYADLLVPVGLGLTFALVFGLSPLLFRLILGARPLEPGPLRERLDAYGHASGFRPNDILVWRTGDSVTNALFVGIIPKLRYVVLTDALMNKLSEDQIVAVYAHEAGHGKCRHTLSFLGMALALIMVSSALSLFLNGWMEPVLLEMDPGAAESLMGDLTLLIHIAVMAAFFLVGLGWVSRRFETEADLHAVRTVGSVEAMQTALEAVGLHSGAMQKGRGGSRHFGIGTRIGLINRYTCEEDFRAGFDAVLRRCRRGIVLLLLLGVLGLAWHAPGKLALGAAYWDLTDGAEIEDEEPDRARALYRRAAETAREAQEGIGADLLALRAREVAALAALTDVHLKVGDNDAARRTLERISERVLPSDEIGTFNLAYLRLILHATEGGGSEGEARELVSEYDRLTRGRDDPSKGQLYTDFFLVLRALGADKARPGGDTSIYSPAARLVLAEPEDRDDALRTAAREDTATRRYRLALIRRIDPELADSLSE